MINAGRKDSVVAPGTTDVLCAFPQDLLPVAASTLCCLRFAERFLHAATPMAAEEVGAVMRSALNLATRLADARDSRRGGTPVRVTSTELLAKGRQLFPSGGGIAAVRAAVAIQRDPQAEASEMLLLRQLHELKSEVLASSGGDRWCLLVEIGGEAVAVGAIPPASAAGSSASGSGGSGSAGAGSGGSLSCDFVVFSPRARPGYPGAHVANFSTIRGLQLHLLSVLRDTPTVQGGSSPSAGVLLTVVMRQLSLGCPQGERLAREKLERRVLEVSEMERRLLGNSLTSGANPGAAAADDGTGSMRSQTAAPLGDIAAAVSETAASASVAESSAGAEWSLDLDPAAAAAATATAAAAVGTSAPTSFDEEIAMALQLVPTPLRESPATAVTARTGTGYKAVAGDTSGNAAAKAAPEGGYEETKGTAPPPPPPPLPRPLLPPLPPSPQGATRTSAAALPPEPIGAVEGWISPGPTSLSGGAVDGFDLAATFDAAAAFDAATAAAAAAADSAAKAAAGSAAAYRASDATRKDSTVDIIKARAPPEVAAKTEAGSAADIAATKQPRPPPAALTAALGSTTTSPAAALPEVASASASDDAPTAAPPTAASAVDPFLRSLEGEDLVEYGKRAYDLLKRQLFSPEEEAAMFAASGDLQGNWPVALHADSPPPPPLRPATACAAISTRAASTARGDWAAAAALPTAGALEPARTAADVARAEAVRQACTPATAAAAAAAAEPTSVAAAAAALSPLLRNSELEGSLDGFLDARSPQENEEGEAVSPTANGFEGYGSARQSLDSGAPEDGEDLVIEWDQRLLEPPAGPGPGLSASGAFSSDGDIKGQEGHIRSVAECSGDLAGSSAADDSGADRAFRSLLAEFGPDGAHKLLSVEPQPTAQRAGASSGVSYRGGSSGGTASGSADSNSGRADREGTITGVGGGEEVIGYVGSRQNGRLAGSSNSPAAVGGDGDDPLRGSGFHDGWPTGAPEPASAEGQPRSRTAAGDSSDTLRSAVSSSGGPIINGGDVNGQAPSPLEHLPTRKSRPVDAATAASVTAAENGHLAAFGVAYGGARPVGAPVARPVTGVDTAAAMPAAAAAAGAAAAAASFRAGVAAAASSAEQAALLAEVRRRRLLIEEKRLRETEKRARRRQELCQTILGLLGGEPAPLETECNGVAVAGNADRQRENGSNGAMVEAGAAALGSPAALEGEWAGAAAAAAAAVAAAPSWREQQQHPIPGQSAPPSVVSGVANEALAHAEMSEIHPQQADSAMAPREAFIATASEPWAAAASWNRAEAVAAGELDVEQAAASGIGRRRHTSDTVPGAEAAPLDDYWAALNPPVQPTQQKGMSGAAWGTVVRDAEALAAAARFGWRREEAAPPPLQPTSSPPRIAAVPPDAEALPPAQRPGSRQSEGIPAAVAFDISFGDGIKDRRGGGGSGVGVRGGGGGGGGSSDGRGDSGGRTMKDGHVMTSATEAVDEYQEEDPESPKRRRERLEALRTRKLAGMEERRRGDDERRRRMREVQRRRTTGEDEHAAYGAGAGGGAMLAALPPSPLRSSGGGVDGASSGFGDANDPAAAAPAFWGPEEGLAPSTLHRPSGYGGYGGYTGGHGVVGGGASNRKLVRNALAMVCLAGTHVEEQKLRALEALDAHQGGHFVIMLSESKTLPFKGLYVCDPEGVTHKIFGSGPPRLLADNVAGFYKYNSAAREFRRVASRSFSAAVDAVGVDPASLRRRSLTSR